MSKFLRVKKIIIDKCNSILTLKERICSEQSSWIRRKLGRGEERRREMSKHDQLCISDLFFYSFVLNVDWRHLHVSTPHWNHIHSFIYSHHLLLLLTRSPKQIFSCRWMGWKMLVVDVCGLLGLKEVLIPDDYWVEIENNQIVKIFSFLSFPYRRRRRRRRRVRHRFCCFPCTRFLFVNASVSNDVDVRLTILTRTSSRRF